MSTLTLLFGWWGGDSETWSHYLSQPIRIGSESRLYVGPHKVGAGQLKKEITLEQNQYTFKEKL